MKRRRTKAATAPKEVDINVLLDALVEASLSGHVNQDEEDLAEAYRKFQPLREDFSVARLRADPSE